MTQQIIDEPAGVTASPVTRRTSPTAFWTMPAVLAAMFVAVVVRVGWIGSQSWFVDEAAEFDVIDRSWVDVFSHRDGFPPLSSYLLKVWVTIFGHGSSRLLPLFAGLATVLVIVVIARRLWDDRTATVAAWVAALSPTLVWTAQEVRPYANFLLLTAVTIWLLIDLLDNPTTTRYVRLSIAIVAGCFVHYFFPLFAVFVVAGLWPLRRHASFRRGIGFAAVLPIVAALPLMWLVIDDLSFQQGFEGKSALGSGVTEVGFSSVALLTGATVGPGLRELHFLAAGKAITQLVPYLVLLAPIGLAAVWYLRNAWKSDTAYVRVAAMVTGGIALTTVATLFGGTGFRPRYIVWITIPLLLLVARALRQVPQRAAWLAGGALAVIFVIALYNRNYADAHKVEDVATAIEYIEDSEYAEAPVYTIAGMHLVADLYLDGGRSSIIVPAVRGPESVAESIATITEIAAGEPVWMVYSRAFVQDPNRALLRGLTDAGGELVLTPAGTQVFLFNGAESP